MQHTVAKNVGGHCSSSSWSGGPAGSGHYSAHAGNNDRYGRVLVNVGSADQLDAMVSDIADIQGEMAAQSALEVEGPSLDVRRAQLRVHLDGAALSRLECCPRDRRCTIAAGSDKRENAAVCGVEAPVSCKGARGRGGKCGRGFGR